jgi:uncharacterized protein (TIGR02453 family)
VTTFEGFPKKTLTFLRGIERNNTREWFEDHRTDYERFWLQPARDFVDAAGVALQKVAPVSYEPKVNGSIFRINRDTRFAQDKRPYKTYLDIWFWEGAARRTAVSGFYLRLSPKHIAIGAGAHRFDPDRLATYRSAAADPTSGAALAKVVQKVGRAGWPVKGEHYRRLPAGLEATTDLQARLLRHNALWCGEDETVPGELHDRTFVRFAIDRWKKLAPLHRWLVDSLD